MNVRGIRILSFLDGGWRCKDTIRILKLPHNVVFINIMDIDEVSKINEIDVPGFYLSSTNRQQCLN